MATRTSRKRMHDLETLLKLDYPEDMLYAVNERDATGKAYLLHDDKWYAYRSNTDARKAVIELVLFNREPEGGE